MEKLAPNYTDKNIFIVHIKNLHHTLKHGLKLEKWLSGLKKAVV